MNADDFQDLYNTLRGSRSALAVLDSRALFVEKEMQKAHAKLREAYTTFQESRTRLLKQDPEKQFAREKDADRQIRRLKRKQEKAREILDVFEDLLGQLDRKARREQEIRLAARSKVEDSQPEGPSESALPTEAAAAVPKPVQQQASDSERHASEAGDAGGLELNVARLSSVSEQFLDEYQENWGEDQLDVIGRHYAFLPIESEDDIHGDALYFIHKGDESYLVFTPPLDQIGDAITLTNVVSRKSMSPLSREVFVRLGVQRKMVLLLDKSNPVVRERVIEVPPESEGSHDADHERSQSNDEPGNESPTTELEAERQILDMGAFSQLMDAAQRSGLVPGADQIAYVRDREFRKGNYDLALQMIEGMFSKFSANEAARSQRLRQEEADIASGRMKISPKDLQAKRIRDRAQDQAVNRARSRFNRVLDGLRILMKIS